MTDKHDTHEKAEHHEKAPTVQDLAKRLERLEKLLLPEAQEAPKV
jgi:hypothetical protein